jgi:RHS repeat-associated protein
MFKYGFNGKEKDTETFEGCIAFEARFFDSRLGKFMSLDPRMGEYAWQTPYAYFKNSPIFQIDILGMGGPFEDGDYSNMNSHSIDNYSISEPPLKQSKKPWTKREEYPRELRNKFDKYKKEYDKLKNGNQYNTTMNGDRDRPADEDIKAYEDRIAKLMMKKFGSKKWMWHKLNNRDKKAMGQSSHGANTGQTTYIWVGGLVIPEAKREGAKFPLNLMVNGMGPDGGSWATNGNEGNIQMNIQNLDPTGTATIISATFWQNPKLETLANNHIIPANGNVVFNFYSTGIDGNILMRWKYGPESSGLDFTFTLTLPSVFTYPILKPIQVPTKTASPTKLKDWWEMDYENTSIWR